MKTYEIKMNRSRWMSLLIAILCIAIIVVLCTPYFTYGSKTSTYVPADGDEGMLYGKTWVLSDAVEGTDGYQKIEISKDGKNSTVYTTNILRVNQKAALATYKAAVDTYNDMVDNEQACEIAVRTCEDMVAAMGDKVTDTATKKYEEAKKLYATAQAETQLAKTAIDDAKAAVEKAYSVDSAFAWVEVDQTAEYEALFEAYPEEYKNAMSNGVRLADFKQWLTTKYATEYNTFVTEKKPKAGKEADKFYDEIISKVTAADYDEFMATQPEITDDEMADTGAKIIEVLSSEMSASEYDEKIAGELKSMKAISAEAATMAAAAQKNVDSVAKDGAAKNTADKAKKDIDAIQKELDAAAITVEAKEYVATEIEKAAVAADVTALEDAQKSEDELMKTTCTVKYNKGKVTFTFANGDTKTTTFATSVAYDSEKTISILGYVGFPYNAEEFSEELAYEIKDYYINDVVILPIIIAVLAVVGIIVAIGKKDSWATGICPVVAGIVGIVGYLTSTFMKLGNNMTTHIVVYAIVLVFGLLQIVLGIKAKKAAE